MKSVIQSFIQLDKRKTIPIRNDNFDSTKMIKNDNSVDYVNINEVNNQQMKEQIVKQQIN